MGARRWASHLCRERAMCEQHVRRLPVDCTPDRRQQAAANGLREDVMPKLAGLDARQLPAAAIAERDLAGARDIPAVLDTPPPQ